MGRRRHGYIDVAPVVMRAASDAAFAVSTHAVERARERIFAAGTSFERARVELRIIARSAKRTEERTNAGDEIWIATDGDPIRFVVRNDRGQRVCATVLAADQERELS